MRTIIFKRTAGGKPTIYSREKNLKTAKKILSDKWMSAISDCYDEIVDGKDKLSKDGKTLELFNVTYFIQQDQTI